MGPAAQASPNVEDPQQFFWHYYAIDAIETSSWFWHRTWLTHYRGFQVHFTICSSLNSMRLNPNPGKNKKLKSRVVLGGIGKKSFLKFQTHLIHSVICQLVKAINSRSGKMHPCLFRKKNFTRKIRISGFGTVASILIANIPHPMPRMRRWNRTLWLR